MPVTSIFSISHDVFYPSKKKIFFSVTRILSSANALNLDQYKILFGKELINEKKKKGSVKITQIPNIRRFFVFQRTVLTNSFPVLTTGLLLDTKMSSTGF